MDTEAHTGRAPTLVRWFAIAAILVAAILVVRALPTDTAFARLRTWIDGIGVLGPLVFGAVYVAAALLFVPGAALTIAAGAVFGLVGGTVTVSLAATTAAAFAFLIARYLARERVAAIARRQPRFAAIDRAIGQGGWKIVALLRLVPLFPFSAGNYMFGLTAIRFWPCTLASWLFMLPGTFLYVYLGAVGSAGLAAASQGGTAEVGPLALKIVGFVAAAVAVVYLTRIARKAIREQTDIAEEAAPAGEPAPAAPRWSTGTLALGALAVVSIAGAAWAQANKDSLAGLFGPPVVAGSEAYAQSTGTARFDHSAFDALLGAHVDGDGMVDYPGLAARAAELDAYMERIAAAPFADLGRDQKLAFLINAYNAFTLRLILDHYPLHSIKDIPEADRWDAARWELGGERTSLNRIEHHSIRKNFVEPRIHFALVCAAQGCPKLRNEAYDAARLDQQLEDQTRAVHESGRWFEYDADEGVVRLTKLYDWYGGDFAKVAGSVLEFSARYSTPLREALDAGRRPAIEWLDYDWGLNAQKE